MMFSFRRIFGVSLKFQRNIFQSSTNYIEIMNANKTKPTAGIIIIGDEILKGYTEDTNSRYLCKKFFALGVKVSKISVIPDCIDTIASEIREFSEKFTFVITSGGVGPTHDDLTFEAFDDTIVVNEQLAIVLKTFFKESVIDNNSPAMKLAKVNIPSKSQLLWGVHKKSGKQALYPVVRVNNVTVFPGIPKLLEKSFGMLEDHFQNPNGHFLSKAVYVNTDEFTIADCLTLLSKHYENTVSVGSYPIMNNSYYKVKVTLDSNERKSIEEANTELLQSLPKGSVVHFDNDPVNDAYEKLESCLSSLKTTNEVFYNKIKDSIEIIETALSQYEWSEFCLAFNGGKDCTVLLHLLYTVLLKKFGKNYDKKLNAIYIQKKLPFDEMETFIESSRIKYNLNLSAIKGDMKEACIQLKAAHPEIKAVFMGTRACDPFAHQWSAVEKTDPGWPEFYRISPLIKWDYHEVWRFLRDHWLPYCSLYDQGYTSLGDTDKTFKNPNLEYVDAFGKKRYRPAYLLENGNFERNGREQS